MQKLAESHKLSCHSLGFKICVFYFEKCSNLLRLTITIKLIFIFFKVKKNNIKCGYPRCWNSSIHHWVKNNVGASLMVFVKPYSSRNMRIINVKRESGTWETWMNWLIRWRISFLKIYISILDPTRNYWST